MSDSSDIPEWKVEIPSPIPIEESIASGPSNETASDASDDSEIDDAMFDLLTGENY